MSITLEVGKTYEARNGERVKIVIENNYSEFHKFSCDRGFKYSVNGTLLSSGIKLNGDLIREVTPEAEKPKTVVGSLCVDLRVIGAEELNRLTELAESRLTTIRVLSGRLGREKQLRVKAEELLVEVEKNVAFWIDQHRVAEAYARENRHSYREMEREYEEEEAHMIAAYKDMEKKRDWWRGACSAYIISQVIGAALSYLQGSTGTMLLLGASAAFSFLFLLTYKSFDWIWALGHKLGAATKRLFKRGQ